MKLLNTYYIHKNGVPVNIVNSLVGWMINQQDDFCWRASSYEDVESEVYLSNRWTMYCIY